MTLQRSHLYAPISGPDQASLLKWAQIRVYESDGVTLFSGKIYRDGISTLTYPNPFVLAPALVDIWFDAPTRVVLGITNESSKIELLSPAYDASLDGDEAVFTTAPLMINGAMVTNGLLRATDANDAVWFQPGLSPHDHHGTAPNSTRLNFPNGATGRIASYAGTTAIGYGDASTYANPTFFYTFGQLEDYATAWSSLTMHSWQSWTGSFVLNSPDDMAYASMFGYGAYATNSTSLAVGFDAQSSKGTPASGVKGSIALGANSFATSGSVSVGYRATSPKATPLTSQASRNMISIGKQAMGYGESAISVGPYSYGSDNGIALGFNAGGIDRVNPGSIALGSNTGLPPGSGDSSAPLLVLGYLDPAENIPMMTTPLCYVPQRISVAIPGSLSVQGATVIGTSGAAVGFFGSSPVPQPSVGALEPATGIEALDNLILALRTLGLFAQVNEPVLRYDAAALIEDTTVSGTPVVGWTDQESERSLVASGTSPTLVTESSQFNGLPAVSFTSTARLVENGIPRAVTSYIVVANHAKQQVAVNESLVTLATDDIRGTVLAAATGSANVDRWASTMSHYKFDGLDQSGNNRIQPDGSAHVYQVSLAGGWPDAPTVLGKRLGSPSPGWLGSVAEVIGFDDTWTEDQIASAADGLMFKYHIGQDDSTLLTPAESLLVSQDPTGVTVSLDSVTGAPGVISGSVIIPSSTTVGTLPTVVIDTACRSNTFRGTITGRWLGLSQATHVIEVYVLPTATTALSSTYRLGRFPIDVNDTWSTGRIIAGNGYKVARPVRAVDMQPIPFLSNTLTAGLDAQIKLFTVSGGVSTLETTVPLRSDNTFFGTITHSGTVVAELHKVSDDSLIGTSLRGLIQTTLGQNLASLSDLAVTILALLSNPKFYFRAQQILLTLSSLQGSDGSLPMTVNVTNPRLTDGSIASGPMALIGVAALRYGNASGDTQFTTFAQKISSLLLTRINVYNVPVDLPSSHNVQAVDTVFAYWLWRELGMTEQSRQAAAVLEGAFWQQPLGRCAKTISSFVIGDGTTQTTIDTSRDLWTDLWTALFFEGIRDSAKSEAIERNLAYFRRQGIPLALP